MEFLKALLKEDADVSLIQSKLTECVEEENREKTGGLIENRDKLKAEKKKLQDKYDALQSSFAFFEENGITPESFSDMKTALESAQASGDSKEELDEKFKEKYEQGKKSKETELTPKITNLEKEKETLTKERDEAVDQLKNFRAEAEIMKAVASTGAKPSSTWIKGLKAQAKIDFDDYGKMSIELPLEDQGTIPIEDWMKAFPETREAKIMTPPRIDTGGGARGGRGGADDGPVTAEDTYSKLFG